MIEKDNGKIAMMFQCDLMRLPKFSSSLLESYLWSNKLCTSSSFQLALNKVCKRKTAII